MYEAASGTAVARCGWRVAEAAEPAGETQKLEGLGNPYNPERIEKLFEDAKNVEKLLQQRLEEQEAALNQ